MEQPMNRLFRTITMDLIEPRWMQMGQALTQLLFTKKERNRTFGNQMIVAGGEAYGASWQTKLKILDSTVQTGELTVNERRELLGYSPVEVAMKD